MQGMRAMQAQQPMQQQSGATHAAAWMNASGEIALLRDIVRPDIALVTAIEEEHLEGFGDLAGVLAEEASLLDGVPMAVVPAHETALVAEARRRAQRVVTVGLTEGDLAADATGTCTQISAALAFSGVSAFFYPAEATATGTGTGSATAP